MTKSTKPSNDEIVEFFYGINPRNFEVETVSLTRGGRLSKTGKGGSYATQQLQYGRDAQTEIIIVWELRELFSEHAQYGNDETRKTKLADLEAKATEMRQQASAAAADASEQSPK